MREHLTDAELSAVLTRLSTLLHSGRGMTMDALTLLSSDLPRVVAELREARAENVALRRDYEETLRIATRGVAELKSQLAARDAQIARLRQVVESGAEVTT